MSEVGKAVRAPYWSEMPDNTKIEELKRELQRTQQQVKDLCGFVKMLLRHEHSGEHIVQPITINSCEEECGNLYFRVHDFK
jgi:hemerythrin superfamily protein